MKTRKKNKNNNNTHKKHKKFKNNVYGSGNFLNPKSEDECYKDILNVENQFYDDKKSVIIIEDTNLFKNLELKENNYLESGGYNRIYSIMGTNICKIITEENKEKHPLLLRVSNMPLSTNKENLEYQVMHYMKEMKLQVSLASKDIMPTVYMCGVLHNTGSIEELDKGKYLFAIMKHGGINLKTILIEHKDISFWNKVIPQTLEMYEKLGNEDVCNLDVKPSNVVVYSQNGNYEIKIIDVDLSYQLELDKNSISKKLNAIIMKLSFLAYIYEYIADDDKLYDFIDNIIKSITDNNKDMIIQYYKLFYQNNMLKERLDFYELDETIINIVFNKVIYKEDLENAHKEITDEYIAANAQHYDYMLKSDVPVSENKKKINENEKKIAELLEQLKEMKKTADPVLLAKIEEMEKLATLT